MPLNSREAFKVGFLARCVEDNLTPAQMLTKVKEARDKVAFLGTLLGKGLDVARGVGESAVGLGVPLALAAPPIAGGAAGLALAKTTDMDDRDVDDIKDQEVIDEYRRQSDKLRRQRAVRDYQAARKRTGRIFL